MLWANVVKQYQHDYDGECTVIGITALRNKADVDIHNNILRSTTEAMAAVLGGCDYIGILPFDIRSDETGTLSKRIARNIHHILKHEAHFEEVANAANGAWYIEHLTDDIAKKAWKLFQDIEVKGGFCECVESGFINAELATSAKAREERLKTGEQVWVGVNKYQPA